MYHVHEKKNYRCHRDCNTGDDVANVGPRVTTRFGEIAIWIVNLKISIYIITIQIF